eukprot:4164193-Pyramimonas_sp.AAC.1
MPLLACVLECIYQIIEYICKLLSPMACAGVFVALAQYDLNPDVAPISIHDLVSFNFPEGYTQEACKFGEDTVRCALRAPPRVPMYDPTVKLLLQDTLRNKFARVTSDVSAEYIQTCS